MGPRPGEMLIDDSTRGELLYHPWVNGVRAFHGLVERDYKEYPREYLGPPREMPLIPRSEWSARVKELAELKANLSDMRGDIVSLDQGPVGYCLEAGTQVLLADGTTKAVEQFLGGEVVVSHAGNACKVTRPTSRLYTGELITTEAAYNPATSITATACHQFYAADGDWVKLSDLPGRRVQRHSGEQPYLTAYPKKFPVKDHRVHCLEVEGDHSFIANGFKVHNCWGHSTAHCVIATRFRDNLPYVPLSAYAVCATIKQGRDEGGWCGLSAKFIRERGIPSQALWPQGQRGYRSYDKPEVWANAALHKSTEEWVDLTEAVYDQSMTFDQVASCLLVGIPVAVDFNWWGHSVCALDLVEVEPGSFGLRIWNSWGDGWSDRGMGILRGDRAIPNGAVAIRVSAASMASARTPNLAQAV